MPRKFIDAWHCFRIDIDESIERASVKSIKPPGMYLLRAKAAFLTFPYRGFLLGLFHRLGRFETNFLKFMPRQKIRYDGYAIIAKRPFLVSS